MKIYIACDHRGVDTLPIIIKYLEETHYDVERIGVNKDKDDYPDYAFSLCKKVIENKDSLGVLICGNGIGMSIAANKVKGIRAARIVDIDDAVKCKSHNGCNVVCIGANLANDLIISMIEAFIKTPNPFEEKHLNRINKIINYENGEYNEL